MTHCFVFIFAPHSYRRSWRRRSWKFLVAAPEITNSIVYPSIIMSPKEYRVNLNVRRFIPLFICTSVCLLVRALTVKIRITPFVFSKRQLAFLFLFEKYLQRDQLVPYLLMCSLALNCLYRSRLWLRSLVRSLAYLLTCSERLMDTFTSSSPFWLAARWPWRSSRTFLSSWNNRCHQFQAGKK